MDALNSQQKLQWVQALRGAAAIMVVVYHQSAYLLGGAYQVNPFMFGRLGVDFFFVLSGFIILHAHWNDIGYSAAVYSYAYKRFIRVFPIYWLTTLFIISKAIFAHNYNASPIDLLSTFTLIRFDGFETFIDTSWTLFHEILFYIFFSVLIYSKRIGIIVFAAWVFAILCNHEYFVWGDWSFYHTLFSAFNLDFLFGFVVYFASRRISGVFCIPLVLLGILIISVFATLEYINGEELYYRLIYGVGFSFMLLGTILAERRYNISCPGILLLIGDSSYVLYLTHLTVLRFIHQINRSIHWSILEYYSTSIAATLVAAVALHLLVESPMLRILRTYRPFRDVKKNQRRKLQYPATEPD